MLLIYGFMGIALVSLLAIGYATYKMYRAGLKDYFAKLRNCNEEKSVL